MTLPTAATPPMATPRVAAGALFTDAEGRILLLRATYKNYWDIPGGYVEPGESPLAACIREVKEELGIEPPIGDLLVVDWAPAEGEGDKLLFVFDGGSLAPNTAASISLQHNEIADIQYVDCGHLGEFVPDRLRRRLAAATQAAEHRRSLYCEQGVPVFTNPNVTQSFGSN